MSTSTSSAISRCPKVKPPRAGVRMPMIPFQPPVSPSSSAVLCSTMKPKAIVIMAR